MGRVSALQRKKFFKEGIKEMSKLQAVKGTLMVCILGSLKMGWGQAMVYLDGIMGKYLKVNGKMEWRMDLVLGDHQKETFMRDNGL